ncbi:MAG: hypothetical protein ACFFDW_11290, partial [Candidatus Thorarchaeota archaeon]
VVDLTVKDMIPFEEIKYLAVPVVTIAIEPKMLRDLPQLKYVLEKYEAEDPNLIVTLDEKSGEILLMGLGELHLETVVQDISREIECDSSSPIVIIVERIEKSSKIITEEMFGSKITLRVSPIKDHLSAENKESQFGFELKLKQYINEIKFSNDLTNKFPQESLDNFLMGAKEALASGPISSKPVYGVSLEIIDFSAEGGEKFEHTIPLTRNAVWKALKLAGITTQEPIYRIQITVPAMYLGKVSSIINKRRGDILDVRSEQDVLVISGTLPVAESFHIDHALRSETEGRAFWQMSFERYAPVPKSLIEKF